MVSRPPRPVRVGRRPAEQLARRVRRAGVDAGRAHRSLLPALVLSRAARSRLAQSRGRRGDAGRPALLARARGRRLQARRPRPRRQGSRPARRPARAGAVPVPAGPRGGRPRPHPFEQLPTGARRCAPGVAGGGGRPAFSSARSTGRRPSLAPVPRASRQRVCVRAAVRGVAGRRAGRGDRARGAGRAHVMDALQPRLQPRRLAHRRAQPPRRGDAPADAAGPGVPLPGRRDRDARRAGRRPAGRSLRPRRPAPSDAVGRGSPWRVHDRHRLASSRSTRPCATWPTSAATPTRCSHSTER